MGPLEELENLLKQDSNDVSNRKEMLTLHERAVEEYELSRELEQQAQRQHLEIRDVESAKLLDAAMANTKATGSKLNSLCEQLEDIGFQLIRSVKSRRIFVERTVNETHYIEALSQFDQAVCVPGGDTATIDNIERKRAAMEKAEKTVRSEIHQRLIGVIKTTDAMESAQEAKARTVSKWSDDLTESAQKVEDVLARIARHNTAIESLEISLLKLDAQPNSPRHSRSSIVVYDALSRFQYLVALYLEELTEARLNYENTLKKTVLKAVD